LEDNLESTINTTEKPLLVLRPPAGWQAIDAREIWHYRDLLLSLAGRDVRLRYRQTALGVLWVVLQPLIAAGIFSLVFGSVAKLPSDGLPYFLFAYAGMLGWNAFQTTLTKSSTCLLQNSQLISKVFFPRMVLPLSTVFSALIDFGVALVMMAILMAVYGIAPTGGLLLLPVCLLLVMMLAVGLGLFSSALSVTYRDVQYVLPVLIQFVMYASPVAYSITAVPAKLQVFYTLNPLSGLMEAFRWSLLGRGSLSSGGLTYSAVAALVIFIGGAMAFRAMEEKFADVI
jgi:lipopolysaccharide transport system permease protein